MTTSAAGQGITVWRVKVKQTRRNQRFSFGWLFLKCCCCLEDSITKYDFPILLYIHVLQYCRVVVDMILQNITPTLIQQTYLVKKTAFSHFTEELTCFSLFSWLCHISDNEYGK